MFKDKYYWLLLLVPAAFLGWYLQSKNEAKPIRTLAYFGPKNALKVNDTTYHTIPCFFFIDQNNNKVTEQTVAGKVYVTDFFFTTCKSICPIMSTELERVYKQF